MSEPIDQIFPAGLRERLSQVTPMDARGGQGSLYRATWDGAREVVVKVLNVPRETAPQVWDCWRAADPEWVVPLVYATSDSRHDFEVTEWMPAGSLTHLMAAHDGPVPPDKVTVVLTQLAAALPYIHKELPRLRRQPGKAFVHADIKPANILVRSADPLAVCLTDFGISRVLRYSNEAVSGGMSAHYAAPEMFENQWSTEIDWWALGITVLELLQGRNPFQNEDRSWKSDGEVLKSILEMPVPIDDAVPPRWRMLIRGLTTWSADMRWTAAEVNRWLRGESPAVDARIRPAPSALTPFYFNGEAVTLPSRLARLMAGNWTEAASVVVGRRWTDLLNWASSIDSVLRTSLQELESRYIRPRRPIDRIVSELVVRLDPQAPPVFRGRAADTRGLLALCAVAEFDSGARDTLTSLFTSDSLAALSRLDGFAELDEVANRWRTWHTKATAVAEQLLGPAADLPELSRLPALLLPPAIDSKLADRLADEAERLNNRHTRKAGWFAGLATLKEPPFYALMVLFVGRAQNPDRWVSASAREEVRLTAQQRRGRLDTEIRRGRGRGWRPVPVAETWRPHAWMRRPAAPRPPAGRRVRVVTVALAAATCAGYLAVSALLAPAAAADRPDHLSAATLVAVSGGCLLASLLLPRMRLTNALVGGLGGALAGLLAVLAMAAVTHQAAGSVTSWVVSGLALTVSTLSGAMLGATR